MGEPTQRNEFRPKHFIKDVSGKYPRLWALKGANTNDVRRWYGFGALALICTIAPSFREILELPDWVLNAVVETPTKGVGPKRNKNVTKCVGYPIGKWKKRVIKAWSHSPKASYTRQRVGHLHVKTTHYTKWIPAGQRRTRIDTQISSIKGEAEAH
ncbi:hypothetical protein ACS0TY_018059 [Phlomoides rotata]